MSGVWGDARFPLLGAFSPGTPDLAGVTKDAASPGPRSPYAVTTGRGRRRWRPVSPAQSVHA